MLAVDRERRRRGSAASDWPAWMRRTTSGRMARDSGALLSATDSPMQTGHTSWFSSRATRGPGELLGARADDEHRDGDHDRRPRARATAPTIASSADAPGCRDVEPGLEVGSVTGPIPPHAATARGRDHVGLGLTGRAEAEAQRAAVRIERDRPLDAVRRRRTGGSGAASSSRTMPTIAKSGSGRCSA